jgi:anti-sigma factor RsiW
MRCGRTQQMMTAAVDGELSVRRRRALDAHLAGCEACRRELAATERMLSVLETLPMEAAVGAGLEQATLRRVRLAAAEEQEGPVRRWWQAWLPLPAVALATAAVAVVALGILRFSSDVPGQGGVTQSRGSGKTVARAPVPATTPTRTARADAPKAVVPPDELPPELAAAPDKFMNLPILRNLEKLDHFEAIQTTTLDDEPVTPGGEAQPSNG